MAAVAPEPSSSGDFANRVQAVQAKLAQSVARAGLKDDAYAHVIEAQSAVLGEMVAFVDEVRRVRRPAAVFTDTQVDDIGRRLLSASTVELVRSADRLLARRQRWFVMAVVLTAVVAAAVLSGGMWWWLQPAGTLCFDQNGGRFCGQWVIPERTR